MALEQCHNLSPGKIILVLQKIFKHAMESENKHSKTTGINGSLSILGSDLIADILTKQE